jgi:hypothetical protein
MIAVDDTMISLEQWERIFQRTTGIAEDVADASDEEWGRRRAPGYCRFLGTRSGRVISKVTRADDTIVSLEQWERIFQRTTGIAEDVVDSSDEDGVEDERRDTEEPEDVE